MKRKIGILILSILPLIVIIAFSTAHTAVSAPRNLEVSGVGPAWYNPDWHYRRPVTVTNTTTSLTNYQVLVSLDSSFDFGHARTDGADLRVTADDGTTPLSFWTESWDSVGMKAWVWVKAPSLPNGRTVIYLYYGNASAASASNGSATFEAYDGFESYNVGAAPTGNYTNPGEWARYASNPVLAPGGVGTWDVTGATFGSVFYDSDYPLAPYRMYYHGWGAAPCAGSCIGLATSSDGRTWTKYGTNPIFTPGDAGAWAVDGVRVPMVWKEGPGDYRMIYTGKSGSVLQVGYTFSADGINWDKSRTTPVFNDINAWAHNSTQNWGVIKVGSDYLMWYEDANAPREASIATSTDLINWTPYSPTPIFATNSTPSDDRYSQFSLFTFKYGGYYYVLVPSYSSVGDYARYYLYRSSSPYFPTGDRHLVRVAHTIGSSGAWDSADSDTPAVLTSDIQRTTYPSNQLWTYYAGAITPLANVWREGVLIEPNIDTALADAALPSGLAWSAGSGITVQSSPVHQGARSLQINDNDGSGRTLTGTFSPLEQGVMGAWMRVNSSTAAGDFDIYAQNGGTLAALVGLGRNTYFHYWNKSLTNPPGGYGSGFHDTSIHWALNTWYLVTMAYNANTSLYDLVVYDQNLNELARQNSISFGNTVPTFNTLLFNTSGTFQGLVYADDFRLRKYVSTEPTTSVRSTSDIQQTMTIGAGANAFDLVYANLDVTTLGSLSSVQIIYYRYNHPDAPASIQTGRYWEIIPDTSLTDYTVSLTLRHSLRPDANDKLCFYLGSGFDWDCAADSFDPDQFTITRSGLHELSEWAVEENAPTAIQLKALRASSKENPPWLAGAAIGLIGIPVIVIMFWYFRVKRKTLV